MRRFLLSEKITRWVPLLLGVLLPVFILPFSLDATEAAKQTLFLVLLAIGGIGYFAAGFNNKVRFRKVGLFLLTPFLLLLPAVLSAFFSIHPAVSWVGGVSQEYQSVITVFGYLVLWFLIVKTTPTIQERKKFIDGLMLGGVLVVFLSLVFYLARSFFGGIVPTLNTVGTIHGCVLFLLVLSSIFIATPSKNNSVISKILGTLVFVITLIALFALQYSVFWLLFAVPVAFVLITRIVSSGKNKSGNYPLVLVAFASIIFGLLGAGLPYISLPIEVTPSGSVSRQVAFEAVKDGSGRWFFGTGGGTYSLIFQKSHPLEWAKTPFWDTRFDRASSYLLTIIPTMGLFGVLGYVGFFVLSLGYGIWVLRINKDNENTAPFVMVGFVVLGVAMFVYTSNITLMALWISLSALLSSEALAKSNGDTKNIFSSKKNNFFSLVSNTVFLLFLLVSAVLSTQKYVAEIAYAGAVRSERLGYDSEKILKPLILATKLNKWSDVYERRLALVLLERVKEYLSANSEALEVSTEEADWLRSLIATSIKAAKEAEKLSPQNALNLQAQGSVYEALTPLLEEAPVFAVEAYSRAVEVDPGNPVRYTDLGRMYIALARHLRTGEQNTDIKNRNAVEESLQKATISLNKAISLKPDYAPAHFQRAVVFVEEGKTSEAITALEGITEAYPTDVGAAFQLGLLYIRRGQEGDERRAERIFLSIVELVPSYSNARWFLASLYEESGDIGAALKQVEAVLATNPNHPLVKARFARLKERLSGQDKPITPEPTDLEPLP